MSIKYQIFNGIQITANGTTYTLPRPSGFTVEREAVYAGELTTCTGQYKADYIGWKYADMDLVWDILPNDLLSALIALPKVVTLTFEDASGTNVSEEVRIRNRISTGTRTTDKQGKQIWKNVAMGVSFNVVHN